MHYATASNCTKLFGVTYAVGLNPDIAVASIISIISEHLLCGGVQRRDSRFSMARLIKPLIL